MALWDYVMPVYSLATNAVSNVWNGISGQSAQDANQANADAARIAFERSQQSADRQMAFQERMANSAYQRGMDDMKKAGLNPMLAFSQGGASAPSGSSASAQASQYQDVGAAALSNIGSLTESASNWGKFPTAISQMQAQTRQSTAQASQTEALTPAVVNKTNSEAALNNSTAMVQAQQAKEIAARTNTYAPSIQKMAEEIKNLVRSGKLADIDVEQKSRINEFVKKHPNLFTTDMTMKMIKGALDSGKSAAEIGEMLKGR